MGRHRHAVAVRTDGLAAVLGPLFFDPRIRSAALLDVDSGMVLDVCGPDTAVGRTARGVPAAHDHRDEVRGAAHAELVRIALALAPNAGGRVGIVLEAGPDRHVLRTVADPHGGRLALSVVVRGPDRAVRRVRKLLQDVSDAALTAGPSTAVRPGSTGWATPPPDPGPTSAPPGAPAPGVPAPGVPAPTTARAPWGSGGHGEVPEPGARPTAHPARAVPRAPGGPSPVAAGVSPPVPHRDASRTPGAPGVSPPGSPPWPGPVLPSALPAGPTAPPGPPAPRPPLSSTPAAAGDPAPARSAER